MEIIVQLLFFSSSILIFFSISSQSANSCKPESCGSTLGPEVRFPFRLRTQKPVRCGYPGFVLYCSSKKETMLTLPESGEFRVNAIDYSSQTLSISDPGSCLPSRILNFNLSGSPFSGAYVRNYTFLNCSEIMAYASPFRCLSGRNYTVLLHSLEDVQVPPMCRRIANVSVPVRLMDWREEIDLLWSDPPCSSCENQGGVCGLKDGSSLEIGCHKRASSSGLSKMAEYDLIIGVGIPLIVCIIGLVLVCIIRFVCHTCGLISLNSELPTVTVPEERLITNGLDRPTIESYPKMVLGESRRLPQPSDGTCPICLSEYQPKETLRSIPKCSHCFHVDCIDEWLKLNGTCPLCRKSPDGWTATPCSSSSLSSSITSLSTPSLGNL